MGATGSEKLLKMLSGTWNLFLQEGSKDPVKVALDGKINATISGDGEEPAHVAEYEGFDINSVQDIDLEQIEAILSTVLKKTAVADRKWVLTQEESISEEENTLNSAFNNIYAEESENGTLMAVSSFSNDSYIRANPAAGVATLAAKATSDIVCMGGQPIGMFVNTNLDEKGGENSNWIGNHIVTGITAVTDDLEVPIYAGTINNGGNNGHSCEATVGVLGVIEDPEKVIGKGFKRPGDIIYLLGKSEDCISSSEYLNAHVGIENSSSPIINLENDAIVQKELARFIKMGFIKSAASIANGGLITALTEGAVTGSLGYDIMIDDTYRMDAFLFGESQGRVVVSVSKKDSADFEDMLIESSLNHYILLGEVIKDGFLIDEEFIMLTSDAKDLYQGALGTEV